MRIIYEAFSDVSIVDFSSIEFKDFKEINMKVKEVWYALCEGRCRYFYFFKNKRLVETYCEKEQYSNIHCLSISLADDQQVPSQLEAKNNKDADYWGWYDNEDKEIVFIYPSRILLSICFAYGMEEAEAKGQGKSYRLKLERIYEG